MHPNRMKIFEEVAANSDDVERLVEIRLAAMKESLEAVGRYDPQKARARFLDGFEVCSTTKIIIDNEVVGFYVLKRQPDHMLLDHFYIKPDIQGCGFGTAVLNSIKKQAGIKKLPIRLGALKQSRSNNFYRKNGFSYTHQGEWDNYYIYHH